MIQSVLTGANTWLEKKDVTYLQEYQPITGTSAAQGQPKYYAMFGNATGDADTNSGRIFLAPTPNTIIDLEFILIRCQRL